MAELSNHLLPYRHLLTHESLNGPSTERLSTHSPLFLHLNSSRASFHCRPLPTVLFLPPQLPSRCFQTHSKHSFSQQTTHNPHSFIRHSRPRHASRPAQSTEQCRALPCIALHCPALPASAVTEFRGHSTHHASLSLPPSSLDPTGTPRAPQECPLSRKIQSGRANVKRYVESHVPRSAPNRRSTR